MKKVMALWVFLTLLFVAGNSFAVTDQFFAVEDSYISESDPNSNFGNENFLLADGNDGSGGEVAALIKWDVSSIPSDAIVTAASITLNLFDSSSGAYNIIRQNTPWNEDRVDWSDLSGSALVRGVIPAFSLGKITINLNEHGVNMVQGWIDGGFVNNGITIRTAGTSNGIDMNSRESLTRIPRLEVTYSSSSMTIEELRAEVDELKAILAGVTRDGNDIHFTGVNIHVENGLGATNGDPDCRSSFIELCDPNPAVNGLGNLIVGYGEDIVWGRHAMDPTPEPDKSGSHNLILGNGNNYSSYGGIVVGQQNVISGPYATITGGKENTASGFSSSISGGRGASATGRDDWRAGTLFEDH